MMEYGLVGVWLVVYLALLFAAIPITTTLFPRLADRGLGLAIPVAAGILWLVGYWVGHVSLSLAVWVGPAVLLVLALGLAYRRRPTLDRRILAETVVVFTVAFCFLVAVRAVDPAVHPTGGEKFLDFGLLKSLLRTETLPPEDMWFAGEPVSYYYGGHLLASLLTRLTGTEPRFAYNLALAGFYAMLVTAAYGLAGSIAAHRGSPRWLGSVFGAVFVGFASNLSTPGRFLVWLLPESVSEVIAGVTAIPLEGLSKSLADFHYWDASRVIEGTINEFPLFAWLNGDLHAHMMSTPFLLVVAGLLFSYYLTPASAIRRRQLLIVGTIPPLAGLLAVVNTWSFPTVGGLTLLTLYFAPSDPRTLLGINQSEPASESRTWTSTEAVRLLTAAGFGGVVVAVGILWSGPFWFGTASGRSIGLFAQRSSLGRFLLVHGSFLLVFVPYLLRHSIPVIQNRARVGGMVVLIGVLSLLTRAPAVAVIAPMLGVCWALLRFRTGPTTEGQSTTHAVATADGGDPSTETAANEATPPTTDTETGPTAVSRLTDSVGFETLLLFAGGGLVLLVEFVFVKEQAGPGRLNTVFKTYAQVWVLWGVAAGAMLTHLVWQHRPGDALSGGRWKRVLQLFAVLLLVSTSMYGVLALSDHFTADPEDNPVVQTDDPTLNATAFVEVQHGNEAPAIRWLDAQEGRPTIATAPGGYIWTSVSGRGASAPASLTGIPTVLGWHHEIGYRGETAYRERQRDVRTLYSGGPSEQAAVLDEYDVEYVYVGPAERASYGQLTFYRLDGVTVAKEWPAVTIYHVNQSALGDSQ